MTSTLNAHRAVGGRVAAAGLVIALAGVLGGPVASAKVTELAFCSFSDGAATKIKEAIIAEFEKANPDIRIKYNNLQGLPYTEKIFTMLSAGAPIDVMWCGEETPYWGQKGLLRDLSPYMAKDKSFDASDFYPSVMKAFRYKGDYYAFPKDFSTTVFYTNNKLFAKSGIQPPKDGWTWNDMLTIGKRLTVDSNGDGKPDQWGLGLDLWDRFMYSWVWQAGGEVFSEDQTQCLLGSSEAVKGIQFVADLMHKHKVAPYNYDLAGGFQQDKIAAYQMGRWFTITLRASKKALDWDVVPMPKDVNKATYLFLGGYGIATSSKHPNEAWRFVKFLTGVRAQQMRASMGQSVPSRISVANSDYFLEPDLRPKSAQAFVQQMDSARSRPSTGRYDQALAIFMPAIDKVLSGTRLAANVMPQAAADATKFLSRK